MFVRGVFLATAVLAVGLLGACRGDDDDGGGDATSVAGTQAPTGSEDGAPLKVSENSKFGPILTTPEGMTLYVFTQDAAGKSNCNGACAGTWPPLMANSSRLTTPDGVKGQLTIITRDDGSKQIALDGKPLYRYAPDKSPGDTTGEGVGEVWFVAKADGTSGAAAGGSIQTPVTGQDPLGY